MAFAPDYQKNVSFFDPKSEAEAKRKRAMADMLIQQGNEKPQNEKVGRYVIARSPIEGISQSAQSAYGQYLGSQSDNQLADLDSKRQKAIAEALMGKDQESVIGVLAQDPRTESAAIKMYMQNQEANMPFGVQSAGFEGDIARSMYILQDPNANPIDRARAQSVIDTAQGLKGSWNPVTGSWSANQARYLNSSQPQTSMQAMPQQVAPQQPMPQFNMQAPQGGLLPPHDMGGQSPDMSMFQPVGAMQPSSTMPFQYANNPRLEQTRLEAEAKGQAELATAEAIAAAKARGANAPEREQANVNNQVQSSIIQDLTDINTGTLDTPYAGSLQGVMRLIPSDSAQKHAESIDLLKQARLELAAPLAKQLGVNPTDKDFQASLDRIFDINSTKQSRQNQIDALSKRIQERQRIVNPTQPTQQKRMRFDAQGNLTQ